MVLEKQHDDVSRAKNARRQAEFQARERRRRGLAVHNRLKDPSVKRLFDPKVATMLHRMGPLFAGDLTETQVHAGELIARIYGEHDRATGARPRQSRSPVYERSYGRSEIRMDDELAARAKKRFDRLDAVFKVIPSPEARAHARAVLVHLCVEDQPVASALTPGIQTMLALIAKEFELGGKHEHRGGQPSTARRPPKSSTARARRGESIVREHWEECERQFAPDITDAELEHKWRAHREAEAKARATIDRDAFRAEKARRRR